MFRDAQLCSPLSYLSFNSVWINFDTFSCYFKNVVLHNYVCNVSVRISSSGAVRVRWALFPRRSGECWRDNFIIRQHTLVASQLMDFYSVLGWSAAGHTLLPGDKQGWRGMLGVQGQRRPSSDLWRPAWKFCSRAANEQHEMPLHPRWLVTIM